MIGIGMSMGGAVSQSVPTSWSTGLFDQLVVSKYHHRLTNKYTFVFKTIGEHGEHIERMRHSICLFRLVRLMIMTRRYECGWMQR